MSRPLLHDIGSDPVYDLLKPFFIYPFECIFGYLYLIYKRTLIL